MAQDLASRATNGLKDRFNQDSGRDSGRRSSPLEFLEPSRLSRWTKFAKLINAPETARLRRAARSKPESTLQNEEYEHSQF